MILRPPLVGLAGLFSLAAWGQVGLVTWLHPQPEGRLAVESAVPGVTTQIRTADGSEITDSASLASAGWEAAGDGFWQTPHRAGGGKLRITASGLPSGTQRVYLRYFTQPRRPGNPWWFILLRGLEGGREAGDSERIIAGTGGHDPKTVYETCIGSVGTEEQPVTEVCLWVQRYEWSELGRFGSIRIETEPSLHASASEAPTPATERVRTVLLANGPTLDGKPAYGVAVVSGTLKVRPKSFASLDGQPLAALLDIAAAQGEYENRQVVLYCPDRDLTGITLECSPLMADDERVIAASELLFAPVGYCPYRVPHDLSIHGYWPEPILPFLKEFTVRRGDVQTCGTACMFHGTPGRASTAAP
jgi:hypothetical protein